MTRLGIDLAWSRPTVAQIKATGATWVARYFSNDDSKDLHAAEVHAYPAAGIDIVVVFETTTGRARAGRAAGAADARNADAQRKAAGLPDDMVLHFAVDEDTSWASVAPYFDGVASYLGQTRTGVYGGLDVINGAYAAGYRYLWQTVAWSEGRWSPHATIRQTGGTTLGGSADWDTAMTTDFGQYPRPITPQEQDMTPEQEAKLDKLIALAQGPGNQGYRNAEMDAASVKAGHGHIPDVYGYTYGTYNGVQQLLAKVGALTSALATVAKGIADPAVIQDAAEAGALKALESGVVHVQVDVHDPNTPTT